MRLPVVRRALGVAFLFLPALAQSQASSPSLLVAPGPESNVQVSSIERNVRFSIGTGNRPMTLVRDSALLLVPVDGGPLAPVQLVVDVISRPSSPYPDKSESEIEGKAGARSKPDPDPEAFSGKVKLDGAWFEVSGFGPTGTRSSSNALHYFGARHGKAYMIMAHYETGRIATQAVRAMMDSLQLPEPAVREVTSAYDAFAAGAATPEGLQTNFGRLAFKGADKFKLDSMTSSRPGYYLASFEAAGARLTASCSPVAPEAVADRAASDRKLFDIPVLSGLASVPPEAGAGDDIRHYTYMRETIYGGKAAEEAWTAVHGGHLFVLSLAGKLGKGGREQLLAQLAAASCQPMRIEP